MHNLTAPICQIEITSVGPLAGEFTDHGIWVLFHEHAPEEVAEFALLHRAVPPNEPLAPGQLLTIDQERYTITAVGAVANENLVNLGHLVLKANGLEQPELPGDVCVEARELPRPVIGLCLSVWAVTGVAP
jgi:PTS system glucitol/sorbitol-specific IIA component